MSTPSNAMPESRPDSPAAAPAAMPTRPFYWSVRRELWENRSIYIAPLAVGAVALFGFLVSTIGMPERRRATLLLEPAKQRALIEQPYDVTAMIMIFTAFMVGVFYCLDALHGERRDRSILFWKSLPVSNLTTVLSKAIIPLAVLPLVVFAITISMHLIMLLLSDAILLSNGVSTATWDQLPLLFNWLTLVYGLIVIALWHAPIYGWLLLVSGWARRATFLWAVLPPFAICIVERIGFGTWNFAHMLGYRLTSWGAEAFEFKPHGGMAIESLAQLTPGRFLSTPGLWLGLIFAAACVAAAVRQRRYREPI